MGILNLLIPKNIDEGVNEFRKTSGAVLLDVRTKEEYAAGHIPGSVNLPLADIGDIGYSVKSKSTPLFVHCLSGARSGQAVRQLQALGYTNVRNIGGIGNYHGEIGR